MIGAASAGGRSTGVTTVVSVIGTVTTGMVGAGVMPAGGVRASTTDAVMTIDALIHRAMLTSGVRVVVIGTGAGMSEEMAITAMGEGRSAIS